MNNLKLILTIRKIIKFLIFQCCLFGTLVSNELNQDSTKKLYSNTASILKSGETGFSLLKNTRFGLSDNFEISLHPLIVWLTPGLELKWKQIVTKEYIISSVHKINYPSLLLRTLQIKGSGGLISREFKVPDMISVENGVMISNEIFPSHFLTSRLGFEFSVSSFEPDEGTSIDLPIIYSSEAVFYKKYGLIGNISVEGNLLDDFDYYYSGTVKLFPKDKIAYFWENDFIVIYNLHKRFKLAVGSLLLFGIYPFGSQWHLLPVIDFRWYINI